MSRPCPQGQLQFRKSKLWWGDQAPPQTLCQPQPMLVPRGVQDLVAARCDAMGSGRRMWLR